MTELEETWRKFQVSHLSGNLQVVLNFISFKQTIDAFHSMIEPTLVREWCETQLLEVILTKPTISKQTGAWEFILWIFYHKRSITSMTWSVSGCQVNRGYQNSWHFNTEYHILKYISHVFLDFKSTLLCKKQGKAKKRVIQKCTIYCIQ